MAYDFVVVGGGIVGASTAWQLMRAHPEATLLLLEGEYYDVAPSKAGLVQRLIYPVPNPDLPFLGVHLTPRARTRSWG